MLFRQFFFLGVLAAVSFSVHAEIPAACADFGTGIRMIPYIEKDGTERDLSGDFNGDGILDQVFVLVVDRNSKFSADVKTYNPFVKNQKKVVMPDKPTFAIGIVEGGAEEKKCKKMALVLYSKVFFAYLIADLELNDYFYVRVFKNPGSDHFKEWKHLYQGKSFKHDFFTVEDDFRRLTVYWEKGVYKWLFFKARYGDD